MASTLKFEIITPEAGRLTQRTWRWSPCRAFIFGPTRRTRARPADDDGAGRNHRARTATTRFCHRRRTHRSHGQPCFHPHRTWRCRRIRSTRRKPRRPGSVPKPDSARNFGRGSRHRQRVAGPLARPAQCQAALPSIREYGNEKGAGMKTESASGTGRAHPGRQCRTRQRPSEGEGSRRQVRPGRRQRRSPVAPRSSSRKRKRHCLTPQKRWPRPRRRREAELAQKDRATNLGQRSWAAAARVRVTPSTAAP